MSEPSAGQRANLELAARAFAVFDAENPEGLLALADEEIEIYMPSELPNSGTFRGRTGYLRWVQAWLEAWDDFAVEVRGLEPVGERHVVAGIVQSATGKGSGIPVAMEITYMLDIRGEKVTALHLYLAPEEAVEVARRREAATPS